MRNRKTKRGRRFKMSSITVLIILTIALTVFLGFHIPKINDTNKQNELKRQELLKEGEAEKIRKEGIEALGESIMSKPFIEKTAREKFNLCYPDEIIFKPVDKNK